MSSAGIKDRDYLFHIINYTLLFLFVLACVYPFWYIFINSLSNPRNVAKSYLFPTGITIFNYLEIMRIRIIPHAALISLLRTISGTFLAVVSNTFLAYLFTQKKMPARSFLYRFVVVTMYIYGGLIPTFLVYKSYGLMNNFLVYIVPSAVQAFYMILIKTYIENALSPSIEESAMIDGAGYTLILFRIIFPLCLPIAATVALYAAVGHWGSWFDNMIYAGQESKLATLQYVLYKKLMEASSIASSSRSIQDIERQKDMMIITPDAVRMCITMIVIAPVMMIYPFVQRYLIKGIMIGSIKG